MLYIICHDWASTSGNHSGMLHLYKELEKRNSKNIKVYTVNKSGKNKHWLNFLHVLFLACKVSLHLKTDDRVLLTEYGVKLAFQQYFVKILNFFHPHARIYAMVHLVPSMIEKYYGIQKLIIESRSIETIITLGSSLTNYLVYNGIKNVHTSFHYVDTKYYCKNMIEINQRLRVIVMGAMDRNYEMIAEIVKKTPCVDFVICKGYKNIEHLFIETQNVTFLGYLEESELKNQMAKADISLNVMNDTIGSNVICTSLSMGLAMLVSDVGSIRDYCTESNSIFCNAVDEFVEAILLLDKNREIIKSMKIEAYNRSKKLSIECYYKDLISVISN